MANLVAKPFEVPPEIVPHEFRSEQLLLKLESGELVTGYYQKFSFDDEQPGTWHLTGHDAFKVEAANIQWWVYAGSLEQYVIQPVTTKERKADLERSISTVTKLIKRAEKKIIECPDAHIVAQTLAHWKTTLVSLELAYSFFKVGK